MKRGYIISLSLNVLVISVLAYAAINGKKHAKDFAKTNMLQPLYERKVSAFKACPVDSGAVIFLGNSITEGAPWDELFPKGNILNRGIGGDITSGVLNRLDEVIRHQPSKLFICIGTNDIAMGYGLPEIMDNYRAIIQRVREGSPSTRIFVQSVLPVGRKVLLGHKNDKVKLLNVELQQLCREMNLPYLDINFLMADSEGYLREDYSNDQLHLMGNAYLAWRDAIAKHVEGE